MESELEHLQAKRDIKAARARLECYEREIGQDNNSQSSQQLGNSYTRQNPTGPFMQDKNLSIVRPEPSTEVSSLAQAIQDSITINRLPMPTPTVFEGDPIHYIECRAAFISLR